VLDRQLVEDDPVCGGDLTDALGLGNDCDAAVPRWSRLDPVLREQRDEPVGARRAHSGRPGRHRIDLAHRSLPHEPSAMDDHDLVDRLRHLSEHVARDQDRAALSCQRAEEFAQPAHPLRVEPVRRLVEHEHLGIAEQRRRQPEPLAHSQRVALDAPLSRLAQVDEPEHLVHP
jgi:hypothetical protein